MHLVLKISKNIKKTNTVLTDDEILKYFEYLENRESDNDDSSSEKFDSDSEYGEESRESISNQSIQEPQEVCRYCSILIRIEFYSYYTSITFSDGF